MCSDAMFAACPQREDRGEAVHRFPHSSSKVIVMRNSRGDRRALRLVVIGVLAAVTALVGPLPQASAAAPVTVSLIFNDGLASQYRNAAPALESHGMDGTFYVASSWVKTNDAKYMRFYHLDELYRQGNEIGGMGKDHKNLTTTYDPRPRRRPRLQARPGLRGLRGPDRLGLPPGELRLPGAGGERGGAGHRPRLRLHHRTRGGRSVGDRSGLRRADPSGEPDAAPRQPPPRPAPLSLQTLQNAVTAAGSHGGGWLPIAFNEVCSTADASYATCMNGNKPIDAAVFSSFLDWLGTQATGGRDRADRASGDGLGAAAAAACARSSVSLTFDDGLRSQYGLQGHLRPARRPRHASTSTPAPWTPVRPAP